MIRKADIVSLTILLMLSSSLQPPPPTFCSNCVDWRVPQEDGQLIFQWLDQITMFNLSFIWIVCRCDQINCHTRACMSQKWVLLSCFQVLPMEENLWFQVVVLLQCRASKVKVMCPPLKDISLALSWEIFFMSSQTHQTQVIPHFLDLHWKHQKE